MTTVMLISLLTTADAVSSPDADWNALAAALSAAAEKGRSVEAEIKERAPAVAKQIARDAQSNDLKALWGKSLNFDERAHGIIVDPPVLDAINALARAPKREDRVTHAGFEHTYGYLFSTLLTPFGFKRARWLSPDITQGFGLAPSALSPAPERGTLLANVTYFAGTIALSGDAFAERALRALAPLVDPSIAAAEGGRLRKTRVRERVELADDKGNKRTVELRTDLAPFTRRGSEAGNAQLLVYSVLDPIVGHAQLITVFAVNDAFGKSLLDPALLGAAEPVTTHYNGFVAGLTGVAPPPLGERIVEVANAGGAGGGTRGRR
jgi:hypothetical protein